MTMPKAMKTVERMPAKMPFHKKGEGVRAVPVLPPCQVPTKMADSTSVLPTSPPGLSCSSSRMKEKSRTLGR